MKQWRVMCGVVLGATIVGVTLTSCGGGGGGGNDGPSNPQPSGPVTVSGRVTFKRIPFSQNLGFGLNYAAMRDDPARGITVEIINSSTQAVLATGSTNSNGDYSLTVAPNTSISVRVRAEMVRAAPLALPHWNFRVAPEPGGETYTYFSGAVSSGTSGVSRNVEIPAGWTSAGTASGTRQAAPFAILDTLYTVQQVILGVAPTLDFPPLSVDWSADNNADQTHYTRVSNQPVIVLAGIAGVDTQEYDAYVIAHEFGHYVDDNFSRSDSIGGPHSFGDQLDARVAFGEGFATAFAALTLNDPVMRDSFGANQANDGFFNVESNNVPNPGWWGEHSVWAVVWDLFDSGNDANDNLALPFSQLWQTLTESTRTTDAMTGIFPFVAALKQQNPAQAAQINSIVNGQSIDANSIDAFATTETHNAFSADVLPLFTEITVDGPPRTVRSIASFGTQNKLSNYRFLKLDIPTARSVRVRVSAATGRDPDVRIYRRGGIVSPQQGPADEDFTLNLEAGVYVIEVFDCGNADCNDGVPPGTVDITVTLTSN